MTDKQIILSLTRELESATKPTMRPISEMTPDMFVVGKKLLAWNGYFFEVEWDGEDWCSIGGDDFDFFSELPRLPPEAQ